MQLCPKCKYVIGRASALGSCYCGHEPSGKYTNIHDIESFQAKYLNKPVFCSRLKYNETIDPWDNRVDRVYESFKEWFTDYWNPGRIVRVFFVNGDSKDFDIPAFLNIVIKDGYLPEGAHFL